MNKLLKTIVLIFFFIVIPYISFTGIGENFEKGGIAFSGSAYFSYDPYQIFNDENEQYSLYFGISPSIYLYIFNNIAFSISPSFSINHYHIDDDNSTSRINCGIMTGFSYYFVRNPDAKTGFVPSLGFNIGISVLPSAFGKDEGNKVDDNSFIFNLAMDPTFTAYFFITERVAPYIRVTPYVTLRLIEKDFFGTNVNSSFKDKIRCKLFISIGFSWHRPRKSVVLIPVN